MKEEVWVFEVTNEVGAGYSVPGETQKDLISLISDFLLPDLAVMREEERLGESFTITLKQISKQEYEQMPEFQGW